MTKTKLVFVAMALALVAWVGASAASAQDGPTATADPASVEAAGTYSITLTGSGFMEGTTVSAAACSTGDLDAIDASTFVQLCPLTGTPATDNGDGTFSITMEDVEIGEAGIVFWMGNPLQRDVDTVAVAVGDMGDDDMGDDDMGDDDMGDDDMGDDDMGDDDMGDDDMADDMGDDMADDMGDDMADDMGDDMADDMGDDMADDMADDMGDDMADDMGDDMADDMGDDMADDMDDEMLADTGVNTPLLAIVALAIVLAGAMVLGLSRRLRTQ